MSEIPRAGGTNRSADTTGAADVAEAFLLPGSFGDEQQLVDLREGALPKVRLLLIELVDLSAQTAVVSDMVATARAVVAEVLERKPVGDIALVGYSFGASLALEVAAQLTAHGRRISYLGILDGIFGTDPLPGTLAGEERKRTFRGMFRTAVVDWAGSIDQTRSLAMASATAAGAQRKDALRRAMLTHLRNKALRGWTPPRCMAPGLHVHTGQYGAPNRELWAELCPNLEQVEIPAVHEHLFQGEALSQVAAELVRSTRHIALASGSAG